MPLRHVAPDVPTLLNDIHVMALDEGPLIATIFAPPSAQVPRYASKDTHAIEVGTEDRSAPPSEPDVRVSRIRLSGQWSDLWDWMSSMCACTRLNRPCC